MNSEVGSRKSEVGPNATDIRPPTSDSPLRRAAASLLFVCLFIGGFRPLFVRILFTRNFLHTPGPIDGLDRRPLRLRDDPTPPDMQAFFERARAETNRRDTIALVFDSPHSGFSYAYWRANYVLSGRLVLLPGQTNGNVVVYWPSKVITRWR